MTMNNRLFDIWGQRVRVYATYAGFGTSGDRGQHLNLLFENVTEVETGDMLRSHAWIPATEFPQMMRIGDLVSFDARVCCYERTVGQTREMRRHKCCGSHRSRRRVRRQTLRRVCGWSFGFEACTRISMESHDNFVSLCWNSREKVEV